MLTSNKAFGFGWMNRTLNPNAYWKDGNRRANPGGIDGCTNVPWNMVRIAAFMDPGNPKRKGPGNRTRWLVLTMSRSQDYPSRSAGSSARRARVARADISLDLPRILFITVSPVSQDYRGVVPRYTTTAHRDTTNRQPAACPTSVQKSCARTVCWRARRTK